MPSEHPSKKLYWSHTTTVVHFIQCFHFDWIKQGAIQIPMVHWPSKMIEGKGWTIPNKEGVSQRLFCIGETREH